MSCLKVLGAVVVIAALSACREPASTTTTTSATVARPAVTSPGSEPARERLGETPPAATAQVQSATRPAEPPACPACPACLASPASPATTDGERTAPVATPIFPRRENRNRAPEPASTTGNPASMYGYDRATGGAMRPGAASNPNTTSGADPRR